MSGQATGWVMRHGPRRQNRAAHAVLLVIADAANRDGENSHPGVAAMVDSSSYSETTVYECLRWLELRGWVEVTERGRGRGHSTVYRIPGVTDPGWRPADPPPAAQNRKTSDSRRFPEPQKVRSPEVSRSEKVRKTSGLAPENLRSGRGAPITPTVANGNGGAPPPPDDALHREAAARVTSEFLAGADPRPTTPGPEVERLVAVFLKAGWPPDGVLAALRDAPTVSRRAVEISLNKLSRGRAPATRRETALDRTRANLLRFIDAGKAAAS